MRPLFKVFISQKNEHLKFNGFPAPILPSKNYKIYDEDVFITLFLPAGKGRGRLKLLKVVKQR
jgi:hypothetical protein